MDDSQLVQHAAAGDRMAFRQLVLEHSSALYRVALRITAEESAAEDVLQEAWIKAHQRLDRFDGRSRFGTWMHRITVNAALDHLRKQRSRARVESDEEPALEAPSPTPDRCPAEQADLMQRTLKAMARLSEMERTAFTLRHYEGHSIAEICAFLDIGNSACKQAIFRAVHKLRDQLSADPA